MKKRLFTALVLASMLLTSCFERDLPLNEKVPVTTGDEDTTVNEDTTAEEETTESEPSLALPESELPFSNDYLTVDTTSDGKYTLILEKLPDTTYIFDEAHILQYIDDYGNVRKNFLLYNVVNGLINDIKVYSDTAIPGAIDWANGNFRVIGNYVICNNKILNAKFQYIGYCNYENLAALSAEYCPSTDSLRIYYPANDYLQIDNQFFYPRLERIDTVPEGSILLDSQVVGDSESAIYKRGSEYYFTNDITVKLPIDGEYDSASLIHPEMAEFVSVKDSKLHKVTVQWTYSGKAPGDWFPGFVVTETISDYMAADYLYSRYNNYILVNGNPYSYAVKDGKLVYTFNMADNYGAFSIVDDLLVCGINHSDYSDVTVHNPDLTLFIDEIFESFIKMPDGNYIGQHTDGTYKIYDRDTNVVYTAPDTVRWLDITMDTVLSLDSDNYLRFYTPYGELMHDFGQISKKLSYAPYMSGYYEEKGYYYVFIDHSDSDSEGKNHFYEYYYDGKTGEYGTLDYYDYEGALAKPVLYLYPTEETEVSVNFEHPERLIVDYPAYNDGWHITASTDGTLKDSRGRSYYALYWEESRETPHYEFSDGFCIKGEASAEFLEDKLAALGFNEREANEFIIYWLPIMEQNEYNLIRFELTNEREAANKLHISPAPDSLLRMAMHIKPLENKITITEQTLPTFYRHGFCAIEWGGCLH